MNLIVIFFFLFSIFDFTLDSIIPQQSTLRLAKAFRILEHMLSTHNGCMYKTLKLSAHIRIGLVLKLNYIRGNGEHCLRIPHAKIGIISDSDASLEAGETAEFCGSCAEKANDVWDIEIVLLTLGPEKRKPFIYIEFKKLLINKKQKN